MNFLVGLNIEDRVQQLHTIVLQQADQKVAIDVHVAGSVPSAPQDTDITVIRSLEARRRQYYWYSLDRPVSCDRRRCAVRKGANIRVALTQPLQPSQTVRSLFVEDGKAIYRAICGDAYKIILEYATISVYRLPRRTDFGFNNAHNRATELCSEESVMCSDSGWMAGIWDAQADQLTIQCTGQVESRRCVVGVREVNSGVARRLSCSITPSDVSQ